ncbi:hypothetical protein Tco_0707885 [Tanacetum coccineum]
MQTRSSLKFVGESSTNPISRNPKRRNRRRSKQRVEPFSLEETPSSYGWPDQRTMANYSCDPSGITSTLKYKDVPETSIKLMLFPFSIDGPARIWLDKEPSHSILTWDNLVYKFINHFFPPQKQQISEMKFQFFIKNLRKRLVRHGTDSRISFEHALITVLPNCINSNTFYNGLNPTDQDSFNSATGGNLLERMPQDALKIIENKSKVRNSRNKPIVSQVNTSEFNSSEMAKLTDAVTQQTSVMTSAMTAMLKQLQATTAPASVKAVSESCVTVACSI